MISKTSLRAEILQKRALISASDHTAFSRAVGASIIGLEAIIPTGPVGGFWPIRHEIDSRPTLRLLWERGFLLGLPVMTLDKLIFRSYIPDDTLKVQKFGVSEPFDDKTEVNPVTLLVPLAVFDRRCHRIGYGAGYYDRTISRLEKLGRLLTIGIAFSVQEVDHVPDEQHDRALDMIVTEREIIMRSNH
ncbi:MAG: 5-formyltetrahydrofolate cyclo-ligase [Hyphomicrobiales bacterium]